MRGSAAGVCGPESSAAGVPVPDNLVREDPIADHAPLIPSALTHRADLVGGAASLAHSGS